MGDAYLLPSIAAVVLGGTSILGGRGSYLGTVAGVILITLLQSILSVMQMPEAGRQIIYGVVIVAMLLLYGRSAGEPLTRGRRRRHSAPDEHRSAPPAVVVMGVAGCGKSVVGKALAEALGGRFVEGDRLHPPENVARMASGQPLDRCDCAKAGSTPSAEQIAAPIGSGQGVVAACSALKRSYRDRLRGFAPGHRLHLSRRSIRRRAQATRRAAARATSCRQAWSTASSPSSKPPGADERALTLDATRPVADIRHELPWFCSAIRSYEIMPASLSGAALSGRSVSRSWPDQTIICSG